jgi:NADH dehydrogenase [ubiquinone] 1 alpha subcomplex assembly factor 7
MVRSRQKTLATQYVINDEAFNDMEAVEISPKAGATIQTMSERIAQFGGAVLIADYGYSSDDEVKTRDTFRAFKAHQLHDPLQDAGQADLTADVDFDYLKRQSGSNTLTYGPVPQSQYLTQLGIQIRCNLLKDQNSKVAKDVDASLEMLISPDKMGSRFKFFSIFPKTMSPIHADYPPVGFHLKKHQHDQC